MKKVKEEVESPQDIIFLLKAHCKKENPFFPIVKEGELQKAIGKNLLSSKSLTCPYFYYSFPKAIPGPISLFLLTEGNENFFKFFFDMITYWLIPGKELVISSIQMQQLFFSNGKKVTLTKAEIEITSCDDFEQLKANVPILEKELLLGLQSKYHALRIQEFKGIDLNTKITFIQQQIARLISRFPKFLDRELIREMQYLLVTTSEEFKNKRHSRHLGRIAVLNFLFRKQLRKEVLQHPGKRHLLIKFFPSCLYELSQCRQVLSLMVAVNFLQDQEVFEERHVMSAIHNYIPLAKAVEHSFISYIKRDENLCILYIELEKESGETFSLKEKNFLQQKLSSDLKDYIEHLLHPVFMPRNDEEIMRNILMLSSQIKYIDDLPQVIISFDKQTQTDLYFNVILVRLRKGNRPIHELFKAAKGQTPLGYIHDRSKITGSIRRYEKEATVFFLKIAIDQFLRRDHSIDLNKARQIVLKELSKVVGQMRDFNGGMITKQNEAFLALKKEMEGISYNEIFLENFFYSLTPDAMRTVLDLSLLKELYLYVIDTVKSTYISPERFSFKVRTFSDYVFAVVKTEDKGMREYLTKAIRKFKHNHCLVSSFVVIYDIDYMGYLFLSDEIVQQEAFCYFVQTAMLLREPRYSTHSYAALIRPDYED